MSEHELTQEEREMIHAQRMTKQEFVARVMRDIRKRQNRQRFLGNKYLGEKLTRMKYKALKKKRRGT